MVINNSSRLNLPDIEYADIGTTGPAADFFVLELLVGRNPAARALVAAAAADSRTEKRVAENTAAAVAAAVAVAVAVSAKVECWWDFWQGATLLPMPCLWRF
jgi:hypothetical protein